MEWRNIYRGLFMGASDAVPGVSGGTIAVVLGIYDRLIEAVNGFFSKDVKKHLSFLIPLGIGVLISLFALANVMEWLFKNHPQPTQFAFLGLIIGVLPFLYRQSNMKGNASGKHVLMFLIGVCLVGSLAFLQEGDATIVTDYQASTYLWLFASGFIASAAMILPGISGSFLLYVIGSYWTIMNAITTLNLLVLGLIGMGVVLGILSMSKIIHYFISRFPIGTYVLVIGMVVGSVFVIFPGWPTAFVPMIICIGTFALGLFIAYLLGRIEYR
ncbi:hypothetical protein J416_11055 [Gracilibacillus halophilus YIM-C55.5]|uniref:DUF368 domain-containing protein n=1 Tax=Gracilibacillus halophilus YIM-C55.5 TaxID=1308866 RepID=N4WJN1_9BACI|nr:DUF368 domain-containing protein [Gracilibacillus halophilus]ENH96377.1 hypothetical protein J416_11055 [Gracilibacillus halophilus YIM-C55.5]